MDELKPRQAKKFDAEFGENIDDGDPAVCATPFADIAIFRALINDKNLEEVDYNSSFGTNEDGGLFCSVSDNALDVVKGKLGYVYIFRKDEFKETGAMESRINKSVKPIDTVVVSVDDLPENINII